MRWCSIGSSSSRRSLFPSHDVQLAVVTQFPFASNICARLDGLPGSLSFAFASMASLQSVNECAAVAEMNERGIAVQLIA